MNNIPNVKIGIIVGSTDWLPSEIAINNRKKLVENYVSKYGAENIFECSICLTDNEANLKRALKEIENAECNALCMYFANYGPESAGTLLAQKFQRGHVFAARLLHHFGRQGRSGRLMVPFDLVKIIPDILLVEGRLVVAGLVAFYRPEAGAVGSEHLISDHDISILIKSELKLGISYDDTL